MPTKKKSVEFTVVQDEQKRLSELIPLAKKVDIVSAWVTQTSIFQELVKRAEENESEEDFFRLVTGTSSGGTDPEIFPLLEKVRGASCNVPNQNPNKPGIFHPKLYIFHEVEGDDIALVGSMNFTCSGLTKNKELLIELKGNVEELKNWFEGIWKNSLPISKEELASCREAWENRKNKSNDPGEEPQDDGDILSLRDSIHSSWKKYKSALDERADVLSLYMAEVPSPEVILGKNDIWTKVLLDAEQVLKKRNWLPDDGRVLAGNVDPYKPFGTMRGNGNFCGMMVNSKNPTVRVSIQKILRRFQKINVDHLDAQNKAKKVTGYLSMLCKEKSVGVATASRLLTLARPDLAFSYNGSSFKRLHAIFGFSGKSPTEKKYQQLLELFYSTEWYQSPKPKRSNAEQLVWSCRLALVDLFVYEHNTGSAD